jgi:DNA-binding GntR family transcriptional regulator
MVTAPQSASIYAGLRRAIQDLELAPGERLTERGLESAFEASRTPVRAALFQLQNDGLVRRDGRGWIVAPIDLEEIRALEEFREAVEVAAVRLACERAADADLGAAAEMLASFPLDASREEGHQMGMDFHVGLARLSGNRFLVESVSAAMTRLARPRWLEVRTDQGRRQAWEEHRRALDAVLARDAEAAEALIVAHLRSTRDRLLASLTAERKRFRANGMAIVDAKDGAARRSAPQT